MRTTINLDDEALGLAKCYAETHSLSLGRAVSELVRRGLEARCPAKRVNGLLIFDPPPGTPEVTTELVKRLGADAL